MSTKVERCGLVGTHEKKNQLSYQFKGFIIIFKIIVSKDSSPAQISTKLQSCIFNNSTNFSWSWISERLLILSLSKIELKASFSSQVLFQYSQSANIPTLSVLLVNLASSLITSFSFLPIFNSSPDFIQLLKSQNLSLNHLHHYLINPQGHHFSLLVYSI